MDESGTEEEATPQRGDYRLAALLAEDACSRIYLAEQISMGRVVVLEELNEEARGDADLVRKFFAEVRAKAAVDHPGVGSVYEAVDDREASYVTREYLGAESFEELRRAGAAIAPAAMATYLRQIGSAMEYLEQQGIATRPLEARHLYLGAHDVVRLANLARPDAPGDGAAARDRALVAEVCLDLLQRGAPGATRTTTLLHLMADRAGDPLSWTQVHHTARKLAQDLSEGAKVASQALKTGPVSEAGPRSRQSRTLTALSIGLAVVATLAVGGLLLSNRKAPPAVRDLSAMVEIAGGEVVNHDGETVDVPRFWIDAHEVTIAEYAAFLGVLEGLPEAKRGGYDHPDQPGRKLDHVPDDWESVLRAARSGATYEGLPMGPNYPVTGVDWWDAHAYANWKGARLPTQDEWLAAVQNGAVSPAQRGPVDRSPGDVTPQGVHGLAGNVSEWVRDVAKNPAFPMNPREPVCCGASFVHPRDGARARRWLPNRAVRRRDLGFRTVREAAP